MHDHVSMAKETVLRRLSRISATGYNVDSSFELPFAYLRVFSLSAEMHCHGVGMPMRAAGKPYVMTDRVAPMSNDAVRLCFDGSHDMSLYRRQALRLPGDNHDRNRARHLERLEEAGEQR